MADVTYAITVSPVAAAADLSLILNGVNGETLGTDNLLGRLVAAGTGGQPPVTHKFAGQFADSAWLAVMQAATPPAPAGGWPLMDGEDVALTEASAVSAWAAREVFTRTGAEATTLAAQTRAAMFTAMGLMLYNPGD